MSPNQALLTLHADYIGGQHSNYRKWYFAAQLDLDDAVGQTQNPGINRLKSTKRRGRNAHEKSLGSALDRWRQAMNNMSQYDRMRQIALYLMCWGEAAQVRFTPECLCFIFKCADDYYRSAEYQSVSTQSRKASISAPPSSRFTVSFVTRFMRFQRASSFAGSQTMIKSSVTTTFTNFSRVRRGNIARIVCTDKVCSRQILFLFHA